MKRIDVFLVESGIAKSRTQAKFFIESGDILLNGKACTKASINADENDTIEFIGEKPRYVSRGGLKLEKAVSFFNIDLKGKKCLDIGASTGGFTDCMLKNGAEKVYAVDVGTAQLDSSLLSDSRVISLENTDIRKAQLEAVDFISIDVSFISLKLILPELKRFAADGCSCVSLIKPQFEAGKQRLGKNGVIRDKKLQERIANEIREFAVSCGFKIVGVTESAILGGDGNREFLMYFFI